MPRRKLFIAVLLAGSFAAPAGAAPTLLAPGITYERQVEFTPHGPVVLHVITAPKPDGSLYRLLPVLSNNAILGKLAYQKLEPTKLDHTARDLGWTMAPSSLGVKASCGELDLPHECPEVGISRPGVQLRDEQDPHPPSLTDPSD